MGYKGIKQWCNNNNNVIKMIRMVVIIIPIWKLIIIRILIQSQR